MSFNVEEEVRALSFKVSVGTEVDFRVSVTGGLDGRVEGYVEFEALPFAIDSIDDVIAALEETRDRVRKFNEGSK